MVDLPLLCHLLEVSSELLLVKSLLVDGVFGWLATYRVRSRTEIDVHVSATLCNRCQLSVDFDFGRGHLLSLFVLDICRVNLLLDLCDLHIYFLLLCFWSLFLVGRFWGVCDSVFMVLNLILHFGDFD